jgi:thioredoxin-related protein
MKRFQHKLPLLYGLLFLTVCSLQTHAQEEVDDEDLPYVEIQHATDFVVLSKEARSSGKVIMLEMSASYCGYCETLEENIIKPMLRSGDYEHVLIRKLDIDSHFTINAPDGSRTTPAQFAIQRNVSLTPTILFLDSQGNEVSERILGVNTLELYGGYVDEALKQGYRKINQL